MQAVWMVRSRQITRKLTWWLTLLGYDPHDHSPAHRIYLVYASLFWSVWFFAVFSLFANPTITVLTALGISPINRAAVALSLLALLSWGSYRLWQATRRSPFVFSENDAYLICQAPVDGKAVAVSWLLGDWFEAVAPFWVGAATLSIALVDYSLEGQVGLADLPGYLSAGLQAFLGMSLAHIGLMSLVLGCRSPAPAGRPTASLAAVRRPPGNRRIWNMDRLCGNGRWLEPALLAGVIIAAFFSHSNPPSMLLRFYPAYWSGWCGLAWGWQPYPGLAPV